MASVRLALRLLVAACMVFLLRLSFSLDRLSPLTPPMTQAAPGAQPASVCDDCHQRETATLGGAGGGDGIHSSNWCNDIPNATGGARIKIAAEVTLSKPGRF